MTLFLFVQKRKIEEVRDVGQGGGGAERDTETVFETAVTNTKNA